MAFLYKAVVHKWWPPIDPTDSFAGKNIIITGANTGIGFEAAVKFTALGASKVILGVRTVSKGEAAKTAIEQRTGKKGVVEVWPLDMDSYDSIKAFAEKASQLPHLDIALLNAGLISVKYQASKYGWEETLQVNTISTALLGLLLLPKMKASKIETFTPVLEIVSSGNHMRVAFTEKEMAAKSILESLNNPKTYAVSRQYSISKLLVMYVLQSLANMALGEDGEADVIVTSVCPGFTKSNLARGYNNIIAQAGKAMMGVTIQRSTEAGSRSLVSGVTLGKESHGRFWQHDELQPPVPLLKGEEGEKLRKQIWSEVLDALRKDVPEISEFAKA